MKLADELKRLVQEWHNAQTIGQTKAPRERMWHFIEEHAESVVAALEQADDYPDLKDAYNRSRNAQATIWRKHAKTRWPKSSG